MKFPVLFKSDSTREEIATIVQAAAEYKEYPTSCEFIIFYFVGNGIVDEDGQPFLYDKADNKLSVHKYVVAPFFPESSPVLGGRACLFFFDCCLSSQFEDSPQTKKKDVALPTYENCLFVYNGYEKATGQWTPFFNENVKDKLSIFDIVSKTCGDIKNQNSEEFHEPYIFSSISPVFINGKKITCDQASEKESEVTKPFFQYTCTFSIKFRETRYYLDLEKESKVTKLSIVSHITKPLHHHVVDDVYNAYTCT